MLNVFLRPLLCGNSLKDPTLEAGVGPGNGEEEGREAEVGLGLWIPFFLGSEY